MPSTVPTSAIRRPIAPRPMTASRLPRSSKPSYPSRTPHAPRLTALSSIVTRRASASISSNACSLTACVVRPGACTTAIPAALAATVSMLSSPAPHRPTTCEVWQATAHLGGDPAPPTCQHRAYLVERQVGVQLDRIRHHPDLVGSFEQRERVRMHRFEQDDHLASRNSGSKIASSKIAGSTY